MAEHVMDARTVAAVEAAMATATRVVADEDEFPELPEDPHDYPHVVAALLVVVHGLAIHLRAMGGDPLIVVQQASLYAARQTQ